MVPTLRPVTVSRFHCAAPPTLLLATDSTVNLASASTSKRAHLSRSSTNHSASLTTDYLAAVQQLGCSSIDLMGSIGSLLVVPVYSIHLRVFGVCYELGV